MENILANVKNIHLIGIGGVGMSGLALLLQESGYEVSGSDIGESCYLEAVRQAGIKVVLSHDPQQVIGKDLVCYSSAIKEDNPEFREARRRGITVIKRGALLGAFSSGKKVIAVTGSHGKTTTSALIAFLLKSCGHSPTTFIGAQPRNYERLAWLGDHDLFVIEADESDGSFLYYSPRIAVVTNIDREHLDYYKDEQKLFDSFRAFIHSAQELAVGWGDPPQLGGLLKEVTSLSFGLGRHNQIRAENIVYEKDFTVFDLIIDKQCFAGVRLPLPGEHNVRNALAALAVVNHLQIDMPAALSHLEHFKSTKRRFQIKETASGVTFVDDYAHHPTEIKATLKAARQVNPGRLVVVFQPHRYSRAGLLAGEFSRSFGDCQCLVVTDIYPASEKKPPDFDEESFRAGIKQNFSGEFVYVPRERLVDSLPALFQEGDMVLFLGAGDIDILSDEVARQFKRNRSPV